MNDAATSHQELYKDLLNSIEATPIATVVTDYGLPDNPVIAANAAFVALTGYPRDQIIGRNCRFLGGAATEPEARAALREAIAGGRPIVVEITNYRADGSAFRNAVMVAPVCDSSGGVVLFVGSQMDISAQPDGGLRASRARQLLETLTARQRQVLGLMASGYRSKQIAGELHINEKTVKMHRSRLFARLRARTMADAVRIAVEGNLEPSNRA